MNEKLPLHTKHRPDTFDKVIGNADMMVSLRSILDRDEGVPHALLFYGPSGCGKTTLARIVANELRCSAHDFHEYNAADTRGIDTVREIAANCAFMPMSGPVRVYLLDECHRLTQDGANALLKVLEEPPSHAYFILCTTEPEKLLATIKTRCSAFQVRLLEPPDMTKLLNTVCEYEGAGFPAKIVKEIVYAAQGSPRNALVILDQVIDIEDDEQVLAAIGELALGEAEVIDICRAFMGQDSRVNKWKTVAGLLKKMDVDAETARHQIGGYLAAVLMKNGDLAVAEMLELFSESLIYSGKPGLVVACFLACQVK